MAKVGEQTEVGIIVHERLVLDSKFFPVVERTITMPNGQVRNQMLWDRRGRMFSVVVAVTEDRKVIFVREPKYGQMKRCLSLPAGGVKKGEAPLNAAKREFVEETGHTAKEWHPLRLTPMIEFADKTDGGEHYYFLARGSKSIKSPEKLREVVLVPLDEVAKLLDGTHPTLELNIGVSLVGIALVLQSFQRVS